MFNLETTKKKKKKKLQWKEETKRKTKLYINLLSLILME